MRSFSNSCEDKLRWHNIREKTFQGSIIVWKTGNNRLEQMIPSEKVGNLPAQVPQKSMLGPMWFNKLINKSKRIVRSDQLWHWPSWLSMVNSRIINLGQEVEGLEADSKQLISDENRGASGKRQSRRKEWTGLKVLPVHPLSQEWVISNISDHPWQMWWESLQRHGFYGIRKAHCSGDPDSLLSGT